MGMYMNGRRKGVRFAVTAPWCVKLKENIFVIIKDDILVIVRHNDLNGTFVLLWDRFGFDAGLNLAVNKVLDEGTNVLLSQFLALIEGEFLVLDGLLNGEGGPFVDLKVQVTGVSTKGFGVNGGKADSALVLLGNGLELGSDLIAFFRGFSEDVGERDASLEPCVSPVLEEEILKWAIQPCSRHMYLDQLRQPMGWQRS